MKLSLRLDILQVRVMILKSKRRLIALYNKYIVKDYKVILLNWEIYIILMT